MSVINHYQETMISFIEQGEWKRGTVFEDNKIIASGIVRDLTTGQYLGPDTQPPRWCHDEQSGFTVECTQSGVQVSGTISAFVSLPFTPNAVAISPDGLRLAAGGGDETVVINLPMFISQSIPHESIALEFLQNNNLVIQHWNSVSVVNPNLELVCKIDNGTMAVSPDGNLMAVAVRDKVLLLDQSCLVLGNIKIGAVPRTMAFHNGKIYAVMYDVSTAVIGIASPRNYQER